MQFWAKASVPLTVSDRGTEWDVSVSLLRKRDDSDRRHDLGAVLRLLCGADDGERRHTRISAGQPGGRSLARQRAAFRGAHSPLPPRLHQRCGAVERNLEPADHFTRLRDASGSADRRRQDISTLWTTPSSSFTTSGSWIVDTFDTGRRVATGPYYHAWQSTLHELDSATGSAQWNLNMSADGHYTLQAWLPAAPAASGWTNKAIYNVVSGGQVVATTTLDQSQARGGDQWFTIATDVSLTGRRAIRHGAKRRFGSADRGCRICNFDERCFYNDGSAWSPSDAAALRQHSVCSVRRLRRVLLSTRLPMRHWGLRRLR